MDKCINYRRFLQYLLDDEGLLEAQSPRLNDVSEKMSGKRSSRYNEIHHFLKKADLKPALKCLYQEDSVFVINDSAEMKCFNTKDIYVGTLKEGPSA